MERNCYIAKYKYLGNILIEIKGNFVTLISGLGVKKYNLEYLDINCDNQYSILKISQKLYFNEIIEGFDDLEKKETTSSGFFGWFQSSATPKKFVLTDNGFLTDLKSHIISNISDFNWEDLEDVTKINLKNNILNFLLPPQKICFRNCNSEIFSDDSNLIVKEIELNKIKIKKSQDEEFKAVKLFLKGLFKGFKNLKKESNSLPNIDIDLTAFHKALFSFENLLILFVNEFKHKIKNILENEFIDEIPAIEYINQNIKHFKFIENIEKCLNLAIIDDKNSKIIDYCKEENESKNLSEDLLNAEKKLSILEIATFFDKNMYFLFPFKEFMCEKESCLLNLSFDLKKIFGFKFHFLIEQITNLKVKFYEFLKINDNKIVKTLYLKLVKFNKIINNFAEDAYYFNYRMALTKNILKIPAKTRNAVYGDNIYYSIDCDYNLNNKVKLILLSKEILILNSFNEILELISYENLEIYLSYWNIHLFTNLRNQNVIFSQIKLTNFRILNLKFHNKETTKEFIDMFYMLKYKAKHYDLNSDKYKLYYQIETEEEFKITKTEGLVDSTIYNIDIQTYFISEAVSYYNRQNYDIFVKYNKKLEIPNYEIIANNFKKFNIKENDLEKIIKEAYDYNTEIACQKEEFLQKCKGILENIPESFLLSYSLTANYGDDILFLRKKNLFMKLFSKFKVLYEFHLPEFDFKINERNLKNDFCIKNDILLYVDYEKVEIYKRLYLTLLATAEYPFESLKLNDIIILICMLLQRNIYLFLTPNDLNNISKEIKFGNIKNIVISTMGDKYFSKISYMLKILYNSQTPGYTELILRILYKEELSENILKNFLL